MHVQDAESSIAAAILTQNKRPELSSAPWEEISSDAKHILRLMFARKVSQRAIARQALQHP